MQSRGSLPLTESCDTHIGRLHALQKQLCHFVLTVKGLLLLLHLVVYLRRRVGNNRSALRVVSQPWRTGQRCPYLLLLFRRETRSLGLALGSIQVEPRQAQRLALALDGE